MVGTIANTIGILLGCAIGSVVKRGLGERYQDVLFCAMGLAAFGLGIHALVEGMTDSAYPVLFIASLAIGGVAGTLRPPGGAPVEAEGRRRAGRCSRRRGRHGGS